MKNRPESVGLEVTLQDGDVFNTIRDGVTAAADDDDKVLRPRAKFNNGMTTYIQ